MEHVADHLNLDPAVVRERNFLKDYPFLDGSSSVPDTLASVDVSRGSLPAAANGEMTTVKSRSVLLRRLLL